MTAITQPIEQEEKNKSIEEQKPSDLVSVSRQKLDQVIEELVATRKKNEDLAQRLERIESATDKGRLALYDSRHRGKAYKRMHLAGWKDKVVVGWATGENSVEQAPNTGQWIVKQTTKLLLSDGNTEETDIVNFVRHKTAIWGNVTKDVTDDVTGIRTVTIELDGGKGTYEIPITFANG